MTVTEWPLIITPIENTQLEPFSAFFNAENQFSEPEMSAAVVDGQLEFQVENRTQRYF